MIRGASTLFRPSRLFTNTKATYATETKVDLDPSIRGLLKPEVAQIIEGKTDYGLIKKINFLGVIGAVRLNTASKLQLNTMNSKNCFKMLVFELEDPWDYYWKQVCQNGSSSDKWLASMKEVINVPSLVERCYRTALTSGVYPTDAHYTTLIQAAASIGDVQGAHAFQDDAQRCATEFISACNKAKVKPAPEADKYVQEAWVNAKEPAFAELMGDGLAAPTPASTEGLAKLNASFNPESAFDYFAEVTQLKPEFLKSIDAADEERVSKAIRDAMEWIQPPLNKLLSPEELANRQYQPQGEAAK